MLDGSPAPSTATRNALFESSIIPPDDMTTSVGDRQPPAERNRRSSGAGRGFDDVAQDLRAGRLHPVLIETGCERTRTILRLAPSGECGEVDRGSATPAQQAGDVVSADVGQSDVADHDVGLE